MDLAGRVVYISAAWEDAPLVRDAYALLIARGATITRPWATEVDAVDAAEVADPAKARAAEALKMQAAVIAATDVLFLVQNPNYPYRGLTFEVGIAAQTSGKRILLITQLPDTCTTMENVALWYPTLERVPTLDAAVTGLTATAV